jgi:hypothetical protein
MRRSSWLLGALSAVLFMVGCGPPGAEELSEQSQGSKATPILFGASCPAPSTCGPDFGKCMEWSEPTSCGSDSSGIVVQARACFDAHGNGCLQVSLSSTIDR